MSKRIVIDARIINSTTGRYVERLLTHLEDIDKENEYIILVPTKDLGYWTPRNRNFTLREANFKNYSFGEQFGLAILLYRLKPDLVHFCMPQQPLLYFKKHVTTLHDLILLRTYNSDKNWLTFHLKQFIGRFVFWWVGLSSRFILTPSSFTRDDYLSFSHINPNKVKMIYLAADTTVYKPKKAALPYKEFIMYVGQQSDYKNIRALIKAHQKLIVTKPNLGLILVGGKNKLIQMNENWVKEKSYKNVYFTGFLSNEELAWTYKNCKAYVLPSLMEGFGLPGLEAMTQGAPVISSNATCSPEIYGNAAHYFDPHDINDITKQINIVLNNPAIQKKLIQNGFKQVKKYSWDKTAQQTHKTYTEALANNKRL